MVCRAFRWRHHFMNNFKDRRQIKACINSTVIEANIWHVQQHYSIDYKGLYIYDEGWCWYSLNTFVYSHLNKNKVNTKIITLRAVQYTLIHLKLNVNNFYTIKAISFKLWQLWNVYREIVQFLVFRSHNLALYRKNTIYWDNPRS